MNVNEQQPATPFGAASLDVRGNLLRFAKEFGTNTTTDVGDPFQTTAAASAAVPARVDGQLGMLEVAQEVLGDNQTEPRGNTYLTPPWEQFTEQTNVGPGVRIAILYARFLLMQTTNSGGAAQLILAPETLVGHQPAVPFITCDIADAGSAANLNPITINEWPDGPSGPSDTEGGGEWGNDLYLRLLIVTDNATTTDVAMFVSTNGLAWSDQDDVGMPAVMRRVGLSVTEGNQCLLDFVRMYDVRFLTVAELSTLQFPPITRTGSRLFIP